MRRCRVYVFVYIYDVLLFFVLVPIYAIHLYKKYMIFFFYQKRLQPEIKTKRKNKQQTETIKAIPLEPNLYACGRCDKF